VDPTEPHHRARDPVQSCRTRPIGGSPWSSASSSPQLMQISPVGGDQCDRCASFGTTPNRGSAGSVLGLAGRDPRFWWRCAVNSAGAERQRTGLLSAQPRYGRPYSEAPRFTSAGDEASLYDYFVGGRRTLDITNEGVQQFDLKRIRLINNLAAHDRSSRHSCGEREGNPRLRAGRGHVTKRNLPLLGASIASEAPVLGRVLRVGGLVARTTSGQL
jgi:hypothetical protein